MPAYVGGMAGLPAEPLGPLPSQEVHGRFCVVRKPDNTESPND